MAQGKSRTRAFLKKIQTRLFFRYISFAVTLDTIDFFLLSFYSLTERVRYVAVTPASISEIAAAVATDAKPATYTSAKRRGHREHHFAQRSSRLSSCCFARIRAAERLRSFSSWPRRDADEARSRSIIHINDETSFFRAPKLEVTKLGTQSGENSFSARSRWHLGGSASSIS